VLLGKHKGREVYTTSEMLELEKDMLKKVDASRTLSHPVRDEAIAQSFLKYPKLNPEQRKAVEHLAAGQGDIASVSGMAGTGKTTLLKAAAEIWKESGYKVRGTALAGKAADGLADGAEIESFTIAKIKFLSGKGCRVLDKDTILVVDEAGMVGTRDMAWLVEETRAAGAKLVLIGDARQLQPIDAGGPFAAIDKRLGKNVELKEIIRQDASWARQAVHDLADGNAEEALKAFAERGLLSVAPNKPEAREALIEAWKTEGIKKPDENLILTATNLDASILNRKAQELRRENGQLKGKSVKVAEQEILSGDRIVISNGSTKFQVRKGQLGTVEAVGKGSVTVRLDRKKTVTLPLAEFSDIKLGYAVTTHKAQGMTAVNAFILTDEGMQDREMSYVQGSRTKLMTKIFTTESEAGANLTRLSAIMSRSRQKLLATDLLVKPDPILARNTLPAPKVERGMGILLR
jgi:Ti-type conjugative transfer relaxase TraA